MPCPNCNSFRPPHRICPVCGFYKDRVVVEPKVRKTSEEN
ncbi:ribosomal protein L32-like protein [Leptospira wolffii serovar Khorat str. Khorat-H2]|nr:ribosomal protein L32-like protein [Leptospira wolffii serovar Khorat str. Khorat-H2]